MTDIEAIDELIKDLNNLRLVASHPDFDDAFQDLYNDDQDNEGWVPLKHVDHSVALAYIASRYDIRINEKDKSICLRDVYGSYCSRWNPKTKFWEDYR